MQHHAQEGIASPAFLSMQHHAQEGRGGDAWVPQGRVRSPASRRSPFAPSAPTASIARGRSLPSMKGLVKPVSQLTSSLTHFVIRARITLLLAAPSWPAGSRLDPQTPYPFFGPRSAVIPLPVGSN
jgi:hypothetical protein